MVCSGRGCGEMPSYLIAVGRLVEISGSVFAPFLLILFSISLLLNLFFLVKRKNVPANISDKPAGLKPDAAGLLASNKKGKTRPYAILILVGIVVVWGLVSGYLANSYLELTRTLNKAQTRIYELEKSNDIWRTRYTSLLSTTPACPTCNCYEPVGDCTETKCLFGKGDYVEGLAELVGYYYASNEIDWWDEKVTCDTLVVEAGSPELITELTNNIKGGNTVNFINPDGKLVLNIELSTLSNAEKARVLSSNKNNPVKLTVVKFTPPQSEVSTCWSAVNIIKVN